MTAPTHTARTRLGDAVTRQIGNPGGCAIVPVTSEASPRFHVQNMTNEFAIVYRTTDRTGHVLQVIAPNEDSSGAYVAALGRSVSVN
ncbi:hypothetical protein [Embleya sp. NPDC020886]|uniref:hypothetical protein n=1 Tax=Embleya sp. NPDC020886 TaxID=3363980 RepID=UPI00379E13F3